MSKLLEFFRSCPVPNTPIGDEDSKSMLSLMMNEDAREPLVFAEFVDRYVGQGRMFANEDEVPKALWTIWKMSTKLNDYFKLSIGASAYLSLFVESRADAILYFSYAAIRAKELGIRSITLSFLNEHVLLFGVFTRDQKVQIWNSQKMEPDGDNLLEQDSEWKNLLYGAGADGKLCVRYSEEEEVMMTIEEMVEHGSIQEPRDIDGRMFFWLGKRYVSLSHEDYLKLEQK